MGTDRKRGARQRGPSAGKAEVRGLSVQVLSFLLGQPGVGQELVEPALGPLGSELAKDVAQVGKHLETVQLAVDDDGLQDGHALGSFVGAGEQRIFSNESRTPLLPFDVSVRERNAGVVEKD